MNKLREIKESFLENISEKFIISSSKNIMTKGTLALLTMSITTGAMASVIPSQVNLNDSIEESPVSSLENHFIECHDHAHEVLHIKDILSKKNKEHYPKGVDSGLQIKNPEYLLEITPENFKDIISNGKSGVYKHPFVEGEVATFIFDNDKRENPFTEVSQQLINLGLDREGFATEYRHLAIHQMTTEHILQKQPHSSHSQFNHDHYDDPNYSKIYTGKAGKTGKFDDESYVDILSTMIHEAGHSLKHQQSSQWNKIFNGYEAGIRSETSSFTVEGLMGYQFAKKANLEETFMESFNFSAMTGHQILKSKGSNDTHLHSPASAVITKMLTKTPEIVMGMTPSDIVKIADVISNESINYDFKNELRSKYEESGNEMYDLITAYEKKSKLNPESFSKYKHIIEQSYEKIDLTDRLSNKEKNIVLAKDAFDFLKEKESKNLDSKSFNEMFVNKKMKDSIGNSKTLTLKDKSINHNIAEVSFDGFTSKVNNNEKVKKIISRITNKLLLESKINKPNQKIDVMEESLLSDLLNQASETVSKKENIKNEKKLKI